MAIIEGLKIDAYEEIAYEMSPSHEGIVHNLAQILANYDQHIERPMNRNHKQKVDTGFVG